MMIVCSTVTENHRIFDRLVKNGRDTQASNANMLLNANTSNTYSENGHHNKL